MPQPTFSSSVDESDLFPEDVVASTPEGTRDEFLRRAASGYTKIRHALVQTAPTSARGGSTPGVLPAFARNHRAAVLYLALLTNWPWLSRTEDVLPADTWIRFLKSDRKGALTWTPQSLSHAWSVLEENQLVQRDLVRRMKKVVPLHESGDGNAYTRPDGSSTEGSYFVLPHHFWSAELHATLSWPALAVLLILLKETGARPSTELAVDRAQRYYGLSRTTAETGLSELREEGFLLSRTRWVQDHDAAEGRRQASLHALLDPYSTRRRQELRDAARTRALGTPSPHMEVSTASQNSAGRKKKSGKREVVDDGKRRQARRTRPA